MMVVRKLSHLLHKMIVEPPSLAPNESEEPPIVSQKHNRLGESNWVSQGNDADDGCSINDLTSHPTPKDVILTRVVLCLGHDGRVAWDVKWQLVVAILMASTE
ncbi:hypothetical protein Ancab_031661 [Ancistrocladus abbreviatus]